MAARFSKRIADAIDEVQMIAIRAGIRPHRFIGVWAVVVNGRVFVRPWTNGPNGWYRVFEGEPRGTIQVAGRSVRVRGVTRRGERLLDAIDRAYKEKYVRPYQRNFVTGFARTRRRARTLELIPGTPSTSEKP
jgi:hypothetical protein